MPDLKYIDSRKPYIRDNEYKELLGKDYDVKKGMETYIKRYVKALGKQHIKEYKNICRFSTLQNYHFELGIIIAVDEDATTTEENK